MALIGAASPGATCAGLRALSAPSLEITEAVRVGESCRVNAVARPRADAAIGIELWLPPATRWSGRYYQMGNGGFGGSIHRPTLADAAERGDAAAATDTGHKGDGFDARWASGRPDLIVDYAYRSTKVTADAVAMLIASHYGRPARRRYFMGCSNGGRQALIAAARWPRDWDGVIAGAPATHWYDRLRSFARIQETVRSGPDAWLSEPRLRQVIGLARTQCRPTDGLICVTRKLPALCRDGNRDACLTVAQREALGVIVEAGYPLSWADAAEWRRWIFNPDPSASSMLTLGEQARYLFAEDDRAGPWLREALGVGDLSPFFARGGRILSYFGEADALLPPATAVSDHRALTSTFPARDRSYRLFLIPGMAHCQGGAAPHAFGQALTAPSAADDRFHDVRRAMEAWAEGGLVPRALVTQSWPNSPRSLSRVYYTH